MSSGDLVRTLELDPPGTPRQRGHIGPRHAWQVKAVLQVAQLLGEKVLGITNPL